MSLHSLHAPPETTAYSGNKSSLEHIPQAMHVASAAYRHESCSSKHAPAVYILYYMSRKYMYMGCSGGALIGVANKMQSLHWLWALTNNLKHNEHHFLDDFDRSVVLLRCLNLEIWQFLW